MTIAPRRYKYLDALTTAFVVILLVSNLIAQKVVMLGPFALHFFGKTVSTPPLYTSGAMILFPITYIFGDVFTEVYGFAASRRAIWLGFFGTSLLYAVGALIIALPASPEWKNQQAFDTVFGIIPRILAASSGGVLGGGVCELVHDGAAEAADRTAKSCGRGRSGRRWWGRRWIRRW